MKIALCLFGQPRNYKNGFKSLQTNIFLKYEVNIFAHVWWAKQSVGQTYDSSPWAPNTYKIEQDLDEKIISLYKFSDIEFQSPMIFKPTRKYNVKADHDKVFDSLNSRFYSLNKSLLLAKKYEKQYNIDFDFLILTRYDIHINSLPELSSLLPSKIYVSNMHQDRTDIFNDNFWIFGKETKFIFETLKEDFDKIYDKIIDPNDADKMKLSYNSELKLCNYINGEQFFAFHLLFNNCLDKVIKHPNINANLVR